MFGFFWERETTSYRAGDSKERGHQAGFRLSGEPDTGLSLTTVRSWPEKNQELDALPSHSITQVPPKGPLLLSKEHFAFFNNGIIKNIVLWMLYQINNESILNWYRINNYGRSKDPVKPGGHTASVKTMETTNKTLLARSPWEGQFWHPIMLIRSSSRNWEVYFEKGTEHLETYLMNIVRKLIAI